VTLKNVSIKGSELCSSPCDPVAVLEQINTSFPTLLFATQPAAATPYGSDANGPKGSPGGYQAVVQSNATELYGDEQFNGMPEEEASQLPALRIIVYGFRDGAPNETRLVADFAGLETDSELGVQPADDVAPPPPIDYPQAPVDATGRQLPPLDNGILPPVPTPSTVIDQRTPTGPLGLVVKTFHGLEWLMRSPLAAIQMAGFLCLLGLPLVMMRRRGAATDGDNP
jgi:hypothetical protein